MLWLRELDLVDSFGVSSSDFYYLLGGLSLVCQRVLDFLNLKKLGRFYKFCL